MAAYALLIVETDEDRRNRPLELGQECYDRMGAFGAELKAQGKLRATESLKTDATRINVRKGQTRTVDGPFAEAKELIGGIFLFDCAGREEALAIAARCPAAEWATVELRELGPCYS